MLKKIDFMNVYTDENFDTIDINNIKNSFVSQKKSWFEYFEEVK